MYLLIKLALCLFCNSSYVLCMDRVDGVCETPEFSYGVSFINHGIMGDLLFENIEKNTSSSPSYFFGGNGKNTLPITVANTFSNLKIILNDFNAESLGEIFSKSKNFSSIKILLGDVLKVLDTCIENDSLDGIYLSNVIHYLKPEQIVLLMQIISQKLKSNGFVILTYQAAEMFLDPNVDFVPFIPKNFEFSKIEMEQALQANFENNQAIKNILRTMKEFFHHNFYGYLGQNFKYHPLDGKIIIKLAEIFNLFDLCNESLTLSFSDKTGFYKSEKGIFSFHGNVFIKTTMPKKTDSLNVLYWHKRALYEQNFMDDLESKSRLTL